MCCCRLPPRNQMFQPVGNLSPSLPSRCFHRKSSEDLRVQIDWKISQAARKALCSSGTPITLLSDMFDLLTLESCEELFKTVEQEVILDLTFPFTALCRCPHGGRRSSSHPSRRTTCSGSATIFCADLVEPRTRCSVEEFSSSSPSSSLFPRGYN